MKRLKELLGIDETISFGLLSSAWSLVTGPVSLALIASFFTPEVQGYYYSFGSILQIQGFFDLGLDSVVTMFASHEWSRLKFEDRTLAGDPDALSRLASLARFILRWYGTAALATILILGPVGYWFFSTSHPSGVPWQGPWLALCVAFAAQMLISATINLLNGCGQVRQTYAYGFFQSVVGTLTLWAVIAAGGQLWASPLRAGAGLACAAGFLVWRYRAFLRLFLMPGAGPVISWRREIVPFQSKLVVTSVAAYFASQLFTPVLFRYSGPVAAGRMGMTWQLMMTVVSVGGLWLNTKVPFYGSLIAKKDYDGLDRLALRSGAYACVLTWLGCLALFGFVYALNAVHHRWAARLLPLGTTGIFCVGLALLYLSAPFAVYLRAHKREPVMVVNAVYGVLIAAGTWILGRRFGAIGVASGFLASNLIATPWIISIWYRCRKRWHDPAADPADWREIYV